MEFTYASYRNFMQLLKEEQYEVTDYHQFGSCKGKCVILRHDIDNSVSKAFTLADIEQKASVKSTYFVLLCSGFYNPAEKENARMLIEMHQMGHEIGLHFDETKYDCKSVEEIQKYAEKERKILEEILELSVSVISMHRPSRLTLENDIVFDNMVNSYGKLFFQNFKYVSDSRMHWREDIESIIKSREYKKLHILTHAFWYDVERADTRKRLLSFLCEGNMERYNFMNGNFRDLYEFVKREDIG